MDARSAAVAAGIKYDQAREIGNRWIRLPHVAYAIDYEIQERLKRLRVSADRVILELASIAFSDIREVIDVDAEGTISLKDLKDLPPHVAASISEIKQTTGKSTSLSVKFWNKNEALGMLMRHMGMEAPKEVNINGSVSLEVSQIHNVIKDMTVEELTARVAELESHKADPEADHTLVITNGQIDRADSTEA
jgi:phage terminase small subunit